MTKDFSWRIKRASIFVFTILRFGRHYFYSLFFYNCGSKRRSDWWASILKLILCLLAPTYKISCFYDKTHDCYEIRHQCPELDVSARNTTLFDTVARGRGTCANNSYLSVFSLPVTVTVIQLRRR